MSNPTPPYTGIGSLQQKEDWTYDATGNWAAYADTNPSNSQTRTPNKANEITQIASPTVNPGYDPAGNMLTLPRNPGGSTAQYALKWDAWNRLVSVMNGSTPVASYTYDGLTRRLTKTVPVSGGPDEIRHYYYNAQWRALEERVEGASTTVDRQYTWGLRDRWDMLRRKRSDGGNLNETLYVLRDYLDPVAVADPAGNIVERYAYDAFGHVRILAPDYTARTTSSVAWDFLFHAEFQDSDTGLYNYGYRYYDTALGRWLSRDPIGERLGWNLLSFSHNTPIINIDILGLAPQLPPAARKCAVTMYVGHTFSGAAEFMEAFAYELGAQKAAGCITIAGGVVSCPQCSGALGRPWSQPQYPNSDVPGFQDPGGDFAGYVSPSDFDDPRYKNYPVLPATNGGNNPLTPDNPEAWHHCNQAYGFLTLLAKNWLATKAEALRRANPCDRCCMQQGIRARVQCPANADFVDNNRRLFSGNNRTNCNAWAVRHGKPQINLTSVPFCGVALLYPCGAGNNPKVVNE